MLTFLESYITQSGVDDMKASAEVITTVRLPFYCKCIAGLQVEL